MQRVRSSGALERSRLQSNSHSGNAPPKPHSTSSTNQLHHNPNASPLKPSAPRDQGSSTALNQLYSLPPLGPPQQSRSSLHFRDDDAGAAQPSSNKDSSFPAPSTAIGILASAVSAVSTRGDDEAHPRGHESAQKRVRLVALRLYHRMKGLTRLQAVAAALVVLVLMALWTGHGAGHGQQMQFSQYAVYIDGGSSGTRVHVFKYKMHRWPSYAELELPERTRSVEPGLSSYAGRPQQAALSLEPLVQFALQHVPQHVWSTTPVFLLATAGLRLLSNRDAQDILHHCSQHLAGTPLLHRSDWAAVISGDMEGVFAWTAANYVTGALEEASLHHYHHSRKELLPPHQYLGVLELGGASFQVTFVPTTPRDRNTDAHSTKVTLPGVDYQVFTHSYLGLGMDSAMQSVADLVVRQHTQLEDARRAAAEVAAGPSDAATALVAWDACLPTGYAAQDGRTGNASFDGCMALVQQILPQRVCHLTATNHHDDLGNRQQPDTGRSLLAGSDSDARGSGAHTPLGQPHDRHTAHGATAGWGGGGRWGGSELECTFAGVRIPSVTGTRFIAVENFFWTARALGLSTTATLAELREAGVAHCNKPWSTLHEQFAGHVPEQFLTRYCFGAVYVYLLLHDRLGMDQHQHLLHFTNSVKRKKRQSGSNHPDAMDRTDSGASVALGSGDSHSAHAVTSAHRGGWEEEVEIGLSWVVGAMLTHAMLVGRHGTAEFMRRGDLLFGSGPGHSHEPMSRWWRAMLLLPVSVLGVLLIWYSLRGWRQNNSSGGSSSVGGYGGGGKGSGGVMREGRGGSSGFIRRDKSVTFSVVIDPPSGT